MKRMGSRRWEAASTVWIFLERAEGHRRGSGTEALLLWEERIITNQKKRKKEPKERKERSNRRGPRVLEVPSISPEVSSSGWSPIYFIFFVSFPSLRFVTVDFGCFIDFPDFWSHCCFFVYVKESFDSSLWYLKTLLFHLHLSPLIQTCI